MSTTTALADYGLFIDGEFTASSTGRSYRSVNPFTGQAWASVPDGGPEDVDRAVAAAQRALRGEWGATTAGRRGALLRRLGNLVADRADYLGETETRDNGKLLREMTAQMHSMPEWYFYFAGMADKIEGTTIPSERSNFFIYTRPEPVGVVGAIIPWNSPLLLMSWKIAPALAAGCTVVVKPSEHTPTSALEFARLVQDAGFPRGVFNVVTGDGPEVGKALATHPGVNKIAFTGSTRTGIAVGQAALQSMTRLSLELGGKSAQLVFPDADLEASANGIIAGIFAATGQTCMAGSRLLVHKSIHDQVVERVAARARTINLGDPMDKGTEMGPLANAAQLAKVNDFVANSRRQGARVECGGEVDAKLGGFFFQPTVLTHVTPDMPVACEELFGPVLSVMPFTSTEEAIELANASDYGLAGSVWTRDVGLAHRVAHRLQAGTVYINSYRISAPNVPFGGFKMSGWGRESGINAVGEYLETKSVWVELDGATRDPFTIG